MSTEAHRHVLGLLRGLLDATHPLPPPHPQHLNFSKDEDAISRLAMVVEFYSNGGMSDEALRHLLFKVAAWLTRKGVTDATEIGDEVCALFPVFNTTMSKWPEWLRSKAGVGWAVRRHGEFIRAAAAEARRTAVKPRSVAHIGFAAGKVPNHLVELTNAAHVYEEGEAMGHCMSIMTNLQAAKKYNYPHGGHPTFVECLTYGIKLRRGALRLFSVRSVGTGKPLMTISYMPRLKMVMECSQDDWTLDKCAAMRTLAVVVDVKKVQGVPRSCLAACPHTGWCQKVATGQMLPRRR